MISRCSKFANVHTDESPQIAEWVIGAWIKFQHFFPAYDKFQKECSWQPTLARQIEDSVGLRV